MRTGVGRGRVDDHDCDHLADHDHNAAVGHDDDHQERESIGPEQHYLGLVNGKNAKATIMVVCPGPAAGGTGPPAGNQTVAVTQVATGGGNTGSMGHEVWTQFGADRFHVVAFANYDTPATIPTTLQLPCQGTGLVDFTTCFGTMPCAADSVDNIVTVTFVNIAA